MTSPQDKGRKYEKIKDPGETCIPLSGAGLLKEDKKDSKDLIQSKYTTKQSYTVRLEDLQKLRRNAALEDRSPRFDIAFTQNGGTLIEWVMIPKSVYRALRDSE